MPTPVSVFFDASCKATRDRIAGALDFISRRTDWEPFLIQAEKLSPAEIRRALLKIRPHGMIVQCTIPSSVRPASRLGVPVVAIEGFSWGCDFTPTVSLRLDEEAIGQAAARFFDSHRFDNVAYVGSLKTPEMKRSRARGGYFANRLKRAKRRLYEHHPSGAGNDEGPLAAFLESIPKPCGVFAYSDSEAALIIRLCRQLGISVPNQISVLGVDNDETVCEAGPVTISSIQPDFRSCGYASAEALFCLLKGRQRGTPNVFGVQTIVERKSTRDIGAAHRLTERVRRTLANRLLSERIDITALAGEIGVSVRSMEKTFRETTGRSIREEIRELRLKKALALLPDRNLGLAEIAERSGFGTAANFSIIFKRRYGMTPIAWRNKRIPDPG